MRFDKNFFVSVPNTQSPSLKNSLEEREAAYLAARARIFSMDTRTVAEPVRQKPRSVPVVAQRMIAHALGQKVKTQDQDNVVKDGKTCEQLADEINIKNNDKARANSSSEAYQETTMLCGRNVNSHDKTKKNNEISQSERIAPQRTAEKKSCNDASMSRSGRSKSSLNKDDLKEEHLGAAKRMFAHALGLQSTAKDGFPLKSSETKQLESE